MSASKWFFSAALLVGSAALGSAPSQAAEELNALVWCDHTDPALIAPFEEKHGVKVNLKEYEGTGAALAIVEQSQPGDWDVFVIDGVDVPRVAAAGLLAELPAGRTAPGRPLPAGPDEVTSPSRTARCYAIMEKFGYNVVSYDKSKVDPADMRDLASLWSDKYKGRIAVYDYYIPLMDLVGPQDGHEAERTSPPTRCRPCATSSSPSRTTP